MKSKRTIEAIKNRASILGSVKFKSVDWTDEEIRILKTFYPIEGADVMYRLHGRKRDHCRCKANSLGIYSTKQKWTSDEIEYLKLNYSTRGPCEIAKDLHKTECSIRHFASKLNLKYSRPCGELCKKILCVELGYPFNSVNDASEFIHKSPSTISTALKNPDKTAGGYHWKYVDEEDS